MSLTASEAVGLQTSKYFNVAGMAILIFDYMIPLEDEARWVWGRSWDATRLIFTVSRYLPFVGMGMTAYAALRSTSEHCSPTLEDNIVHILGTVAAEVLLVLRTYAFWQGDKRVLYGLFSYGAITIGAAVGINVTQTRLFPEASTLPGCLLITSRNSTVVYLFLLVFEMVVLFLTTYKQFRAYRKMRTPIVHTLYRDGIIHIVCIILITFANIIVDGVFSWQFSGLLDQPQITLHSVLASRIMINLRESSYSLQQGVADLATLSDITYHTPTEPGSQSTGSKSDEWQLVDIELARNPIGV